jgi:hypothetical protein
LTAFHRSSDRPRLIANDWTGYVAEIERLGTGLKEVRQRLGRAPRISKAVDRDVELRGAICRSGAFRDERACGMLPPPPRLEEFPGFVGGDKRVRVRRRTARAIASRLESRRHHRRRGEQVQYDSEHKT